MSLGIYKKPVESGLISKDGEFTNPFSVMLTGSPELVIEERLWVRNDSVLHYYEDILVTPVWTGTGDSIIDESAGDGFNWKTYPGDTRPSPEDWASEPNGVATSFPDIGTSLKADLSTYHAFWLRIEIPRYISMQTFLDAKLRLTYLELLI